MKECTWQIQPSYRCQCRLGKNKDDDGKNSDINKMILRFLFPNIVVFVLILYNLCNIDKQ